MTKRKVIIVGGGFAGLYTYKHLSKHTDQFNITVIDKNDDFLFTPLLHEIATGSLEPGDILTPFNKLINLKHADFINDEVNKIDFDQQTVDTHSGDTINYDYLVLATGAQTCTYNIPGVEHSTFLKNIPQAIKIKNQLIRAIKSQNKETVVIVGGGATGVELTAEIAELEPKSNNFEVILITGAETLIPTFSQRHQLYAKNFLEKRGVKIILETTVSRITSEGLYIGGDEFINSKYIFWAAGVEAVHPNIVDPIETSSRNRLVTNNHLQIKDYENVFVAGDLSDKAPMDAQAAVVEAKFVAKNIITHSEGKSLKGFEYKPAGNLLSLGSRNAIGEIWGHSVAGRWVWFIWRTIYLSKMVSFRKKVQVAITWTINLFKKRRLGV